MQEVLLKHSAAGAHRDRGKRKGKLQPPVKTPAVEIIGLHTFIPAPNYQLSLVFDFPQVWSGRQAVVLLHSASLVHLYIYYPLLKSF